VANYINKNKNPFYKINWQIQAQEIRLINDRGRQIGIFPIGEARKKAQEAGLDLVEIGPTAKPPVVKLISFTKFRYQEDKKRREEKKRQKSDLKELRIKPFIGVADLAVRIKKINQFLDEGNKVRIVVRFSGRQITKQEFGTQLINRIAGEVSEKGEPESAPKLIGKQMMVIFKPIKR